MKFFNLLVISALSAALASCGGDGPLAAAGGQVGAAAVPQALTQMNTLLGSFSVNANPTFPAVGGGAAPAPAVGASSKRVGFADCLTVSPDPGVDADNDGVEKQKTYTYACNNIAVDAGFTGSLNGTISMLDKDDTVKYIAGGYRAEYDITYVGSGPQYSVDWADKGYFDGSKSGRSYVYQSEFKSEGHGVERGEAFEVIYQSTWDHKITPDADAVEVYDKGTLEFSGFFRMQGQFGGAEIPVFNVVFEIDSQDLRYDYTGPCTTYESGSMTLSDGAANTVKITYACTTVTATFNGETVALLNRRIGGKTPIGSLY